jgi:hypothetical protein
MLCVLLVTPALACVAPDDPPPGGGEEGGGGLIVMLLNASVEWLSPANNELFSFDDPVLLSTTDHYVEIFTDMGAYPFEVGWYMYMYDGTTVDPDNHDPYTTVFTNTFGYWQHTAHNNNGCCAQKSYPQGPFYPPTLKNLTARSHIIARPFGGVGPEEKLVNKTRLIRIIPG